MNSTLLAVESSAKEADLCLLRGEEVLHHDRLDQPSSVSLVARVKEILQAHHIAPAELDHLAIHLGPGSAAGLRMGIAMAQGWALVHPGVQMHGVPLEAVVEMPENHERITLLVDAHAGQVFAQTWVHMSGRWVLDSALSCVEVEEVKSWSLERYVVHDLGRLRSKVEWPSSWTWHEAPFPRADAVARAALAGGHAMDIHDMDVRYLKPSSAELQWERRQKEKA